MNAPLELQSAAVPTPVHAGPPSFARALSQRGLLSNTSAKIGTYAPAPPAASAGFWLGVVSIYESYLRRVAMEQAFEALRDAQGAADSAATI